MATASRRDRASLSEELFDHPERFEFEQAVRLLGRLFPERAPVGGAADPRDEVVRFRSALSPRFPRGDVQAAERGGDGRPAGLEVCFMGVATPASFGSLPRRYPEQIRALVRERNTALRDFIDLFNHRFVSLFYRARERHRPALLCERGSASPLERALAALLGLGTRGLANRMPLPDRALLARGGLLARRPAPALCLEALVESVFEIRARVEPFRPARQRLERAERSRLGQAHARLGEDLVLGDEIALLDARFRVRIGPLGAARYEQLLPDQEGFRALVELVRFAIGPELDFEVQLVLAAEAVPRVRLGSAAAAAGRLGWSAWLPGPPPSAPLDDAVLRALADGTGRR